MTPLPVDREIAGRLVGEQQFRPWRQRPAIGHAAVRRRQLPDNARARRPTDLGEPLLAVLKACRRRRVPGNGEFSECVISGIR